MTEPRRRILIRGESAGATERDSDERPAPAPARCDCPLLDPDEWHEVESDWSDIAFLKTMVTAVAGVPVGFDTARAALKAAAAERGIALPGDEQPMLLIGEGRFRRPLLLEVEADPGARDADLYRPGGFAFSRLVEAPWGELGKAARQLEADAAARYGRKPDALYAWYLTCGVCSRDRNFETLLLAHYRA
ncbi:hydrolase [Tepidiforma sp.]|uniref:hydrolase n=1 Tax=Tepidiforma sp. TaxID=2682230 RepID=UPI002ADDE6C4|nr:hydrolase [Tepidiforma sp.]